MIPLPGYDKHGRKVFINKDTSIDANVYPLPSRIRIFVMTMEVLMRDPDFQVALSALMLRPSK